MKYNLIENIATYRTIIGYLGERDQFNWWQTSFFTQGSNAFLSPIFGRTQLLAQHNGVSRAAALVHDERIGVGHVYHLFRLPEDMEQALHQALHSSQLEKTIRDILLGKETALNYLRKHSAGASPKTLGPTRVGSVDTVRTLDPWAKILGLYLSAFERQVEIFPYFAATL